MNQVERIYVDKHKHYNSDTYQTSTTNELKASLSNGIQVVLIGGFDDPNKLQDVEKQLNAFLT